MYFYWRVSVITDACSMILGKGCRNLSRISRNDCSLATDAGVRECGGACLRMEAFVFNDAMHLEP